MIAYKSFGLVVAIRVKNVLFVTHRDEEGACEAKHHLEIREREVDCEIVVVGRHIIKALFGSQVKAEWNRVRTMQLFWRNIN